MRKCTIAACLDINDILHKFKWRADESQISRTEIEAQIPVRKLDSREGEQPKSMHKLK